MCSLKEWSAESVRIEHFDQRRIMAPFELRLPNSAVTVHDPDILILGGGAAGLMCALVAGRRGRRVRVIEHANRVGKKILMSGGGRCNFTNLYIEPDRYLSHNPNFCRSALARYTQWDFIAMVDAHGIAWHEKELGQLFCDESSKHIVAMLLAECAEAGVEISTACEVSAVAARDGGFRVETSLGTLACESLVVATGGLSIPKMGATGFGFELARQFGHNVHPTRAGLVPFTLSGRPQEDWLPLAGVSLPVSAQCQEQSFTQPLLFTHRGLSGPVILQLSSYWEAGHEVFLDFLPGRDAAEWLRALKRDAATRSLEQVLGDVMPRRVAQRLVELQAWDGVLQTYRDNALDAMGALLNQWPVRPSGTEGYRTAEVTLGGVDTAELSSRTMQSSKVPGLYFVGEVVDVTGHLGGFNFQWAWSSAYACGQVC
ncbi:flavoprotein [Oceanococcus atlanticus]|uniref:Flavoprotein n=2 Tax=Oceanococcus atlanticus TaxID=1317117 RepID=A0A1Y1SIA0_9GAMM|nr:flavoprotein [Oceanococcus atlanticus]